MEIAAHSQGVAPRERAAHTLDLSPVPPSSPGLGEGWLGSHPRLANASSYSYLSSPTLSSSIMPLATCGLPPFEAVRALVAPSVVGGGEGRALRGQLDIDGLAGDHELALRAESREALAVLALL